MLICSTLFSVSVLRTATDCNEARLGVRSSTQGCQLSPVAGSVNNRSRSFTNAFGGFGNAAGSFHTMVSFNLDNPAGTLRLKFCVCPWLTVFSKNLFSVIVV